jgi:hypothetical protein
MDNFGSVLVTIGALLIVTSSCINRREVAQQKEVLTRRHVAWTLECAKSCEDTGLRIEAVSFGSNPSCTCR